MTQIFRKPNKHQKPLPVLKCRAPAQKTARPPAPAVESSAQPSPPTPSFDRAVNHNRIKKHIERQALAAARCGPMSSLMITAMSAAAAVTFWSVTHHHSGFIQLVPWLLLMLGASLHAWEMHLAMVARSIKHNSQNGDD